LSKLFENIQKTGIKILDCNASGFKDFWLELITENEEILPINFTYENYEYQYNYFSTQEGFENISKILFIKNKPIGLWPMFKLGDRYTMYGGDLCMPYFSVSIPSKIKEQLFNTIINGYFELIVYKSPTILKFDLDSEYLSRVLSMSYLSKTQPIIGFEQSVDLSNSLEITFAQLRKSYKSLINQSNRIFKIEIHTNVSNELWNKFKLFHLKQAGKITRSDATWEIQKQHVNMNKAILVTVKSNQDYYLGFALFNMNKSEAAYAVAAYDREQFDLPIAHGIQWEVIKYFKDKGLKRYIIGSLPNLVECDPKQFNIAKFKMGFGQTKPFLRLLF
jgi:FemAB family protein